MASSEQPQDNPEAQLNLESVIERLQEARASTSRLKTVDLSLAEILKLIAKAREVILSQPPLLELEAPVKVSGDLFGQFYDLLRLLDLGGHPPDVQYLFLGNYVDRGRHSIETICLLLAYKIKYPDSVFLLRGNHECAAINRIYGFYDEVKRRYCIKLWKHFTDCFNCLPLAATVGKKIFCCHGGLSPELHSLDQIRQVVRPIDVPDSGFICDLLWTDFDTERDGWWESDRGVSFSFGLDVVRTFLAKHNFTMLCRSHKLLEAGYECTPDNQAVTIFSAPHYHGSFDNVGAIMSVDRELACSFLILQLAH